jgi:glycosyltransferase involved in cell wall biosynthesis
VATDGGSVRKKVLLKGPLLTRSGYGEQARFALRALRSREDLFDIYIQPIQWGKTSWINTYNEERAWIDQTIERTIAFIQAGGQFDMSLQVTIPNEFEKLAPVNVGYTAGIETTKIAPHWIQKSNEMDKVVVVSEHSKNVFETTEYEITHDQTGQTIHLKNHTPVSAVGYPVKTYKNVPDLNLNLEFDTNFLCVAQFSPRKNIPNTIKWFVEEFHDEEVGLVVKTNLARNCLSDREHMFNQFKNFLQQTAPDRKCKVYLLHGDMTDEEMHSLYKNENVSAFVCLPHGEGFGLPFFEAAYSGLPVVAPGFSGQVDFLIDGKGKEHFYNVAYDLQQVQDECVWEAVIVKESMWAFSREQSAKENMRQCYEDVKNNTGFASKAKKYATSLKRRFSEKKMYEKFVSSVYGGDTNIETIPVEQIPKISLITSVFGAEDHIEQLMEDVTRQSIFKEKCEWIIINADPVGKDFSEEVILKYAKKHSNNIIYKRLEEDPGIYSIWNMAIEMSSGEFITNVNCDDRRPSWAFEKQATLLLENPEVDLVYNDSYIVHEPNIMWENVSTNIILNSSPKKRC